MLYIGVDLGTSAVKLLLMDEKGNIRNIVSKEYPLFFPHPGWSEQNPKDWFDKSMEGLKELVPEDEKKNVRGISFGGQMHGLVILDENDEVIRPAILWNDGRTTKETDYLNNVIGKDKPEDSMGEEQRAGEFRAHQEDHAAEGLSRVSPQRSIQHGSFRCIRYAASRREEPPLEPRNARHLRCEGRATSDAS